MWIFIEDRDFETGHGWRDIAECKLRKFYDALHEEERTDVFEGNTRLYLYPYYSYAWICRAEFFDDYGYLEDNVRTDNVLTDLPLFKGCDNMESHFEFRMTPEEMRAHLLSLGMSERKSKH